jgi:hypothetical protein
MRYRSPPTFVSALAIIVLMSPVSRLGTPLGRPWPLVLDLAMPQITALCGGIPARIGGDGATKIPLSDARGALHPSSTRSGDGRGRPPRKSTLRAR